MSFPSVMYRGHRPIATHYFITWIELLVGLMKRVAYTIMKHIVVNWAKLDVKVILGLLNVCLTCCWVSCHWRVVKFTVKVNRVFALISANFTLNLSFSLNHSFSQLCSICLLWARNQLLQQPLYSKLFYNKIRINTVTVRLSTSAHWTNVHTWRYNISRRQRHFA